MSENILEVKRLKVSFRTNNGTVKAVRDISFNLKKGKTLAIVGESGSGKSVTSKVILGISAPNSIIEGGEVLYDGKDIVKLGEDDMYDIRGDKIAMIFQDPLSSLNPIVRIGKQITEAMLLKNKAKRKRSKIEFNTKLAYLKKCMIEAYKDDDSVSDEDVNKIIKEFDNFNISSIRLEYSYNDCFAKVDDIVSDCDDYLFLASKNRKANMYAKIKNLIAEIKAVKDVFFTNGKVEDLNNWVLTLSELLNNVPNKVEHIDESVVKVLTDLKAFSAEMLKQEKPNFFRYGYYVLHNPVENLLKLSVKDANEMALKYLDENFMIRFLQLCKKAVQASYNNALKGKQETIQLLEEIKALYSKDTLVKEECNAIIRRAKAIVQSSIDQLAVDKDTLAYTFIGTLESFTKKYFSAEVENAKETKRFEKEDAKRKALIAANKQIDWKVVPAKILDLNDIRSDILNCVQALEDKYNKFVKEQSNPDFDQLVVDIVDKFKANASAVVYKITPEMAKESAIRLMEEVGIPEARLRFRQYPFEFSGGMRQRIVIAIALAANPDILICDEPTTALDVTIQSQILELINKLKRERGLSIIFITHDLGVVANMADDIAVMYAGKIVEYGSAEDIFYNPRHPYTWALLQSMPDLDTKEKLDAIPGTPPNMIFPPKGDAFAARNKYALKIDFEEEPPMFKVSEGHYAATWLLDPRSPKVDIPKQITERIERMKSKAKNGGKE